jgi:hypothetical protein
MLIVVLTALVAIFAPVETRAPRRPQVPAGLVPGWLRRGVAHRVPRLVLTAAGLCATVVGRWSTTSLPRPAPSRSGYPAAALAPFLAGALVLHLLRALP